MSDFIICLSYTFGAVVLGAGGVFSIGYLAACALVRRRP